MEYLAKHLTNYWKVYSKAGTFILGIGIAIHEVFVVDQAEPAVLGFAALCLGFVGAWTADGIRNSKNG